MLLRLLQRLITKDQLLGGVRFLQHASHEVQNLDFILAAIAIVAHANVTLQRQLLLAL